MARHERQSGNGRYTPPSRGRRVRNSALALGAAVISSGLTMGVEAGASPPQPPTISTKTFYACLEAGQIVGVEAMPFTSQFCADTPGEVLTQITGPQGAQGVQGAQGSQGGQGPQGMAGPPGTQGTTGVQGNQGLPGTTGTQGSTGVQGSLGSQGATGTPGSQGTQGFQGQNGPQGTQGFQGDLGVSGAQGNQGFQGFQGPQGPRGVQGFQGFQGFQGVTGVGTQGPQGFQGFQGVAGTGAQGAQGDQGSTGGGVLATVDAFDNDPIGILVLSDSPIPFAEVELESTTLSLVGGNAFVASAPGIYRVSFALQTATLSLLGGVQVEVNGVGVGPVTTATTSGAPIVNSATFEVTSVPSTITLVNNSLLAQTFTSGSSISVDQIG